MQSFMQMGMFAEMPIVKSMNFSKEELQIFSNNIKMEQCKKGDKLLAFGEEEKTLRFVQKGILRQFYLHEKKEINVQFATANDIICSFASYMSQEPSLYQIEVIETSIIYTITVPAMNAIYEAGGIRFVEFGRKIFSTICREKSVREMELLNYDALNRLQNFASSKPELFAALPQKQIASYLNITPETFSNLKKKLKDTELEMFKIYNN